MIKRIASVCLLIGASTTVHAEGAFDRENFSANIALTTNYVYRGVSFSDDQPAISGGLDWEYNGFYVGTWASSIDPIEDESFEIDYYAGYVGDVGSVTYSIDYMYFDYPGESGVDGDLAYYEYGGSLAYNFAGDWAPVLGVLVMHSPEFFQETGDATVIESFLSLTLPNDFAIDAYYGRQKLDDDQNGGIDGYNYYGVNLSKTFGHFELILGYSDTDDDGEDWVGDNNSELVFTIGASI